MKNCLFFKFTKGGNKMYYEIKYPTIDDIDIIEHVEIYIKDGMSANDAIKLVAKERNVPKSVIYKEYHVGK